MHTEQPREFRGWAIPGPRAPGADDPAQAPGPDETLDAISGRFRLFQLKDGHRFSTDDLLVAWYGTLACPTAARVLDLGTGIGTVGMIAAWRLPAARFVGVEAQPASAALARRSARYNGIDARYEVREGDFRDPHALGDEAGDGGFDLVLGSPPYFPLDAGVHGDHPQKVACRFEVRGTIADYARVAAARLAPGGVFACVFPVQPAAQLARVEAAAREAGLAILRRRDVVLREGDAPLLGLFAMMAAGDLPPGFRDETWVEPPLVIRTAGGPVSAEYARVKLSIGFPP